MQLFQLNRICFAHIRTWWQIFLSCGQRKNGCTVLCDIAYTANKGPGRGKSNINVWFPFLEMTLLFPKQNYNSYTHISVRDLYISRIGLPILLQEILYVDRSWEYMKRSQTRECRNWDWGRTIPRKGIHKWDFRCSVRQYLTFNIEAAKADKASVASRVEGEPSGRPNLAAGAAGRLPMREKPLRGRS